MKTSSYSPHYEKLRHWLKQKRSLTSLTLRDLAPIIGAHFTSIGKMEQDRKKIELVEFVKYCQAIDADPHEGLDIIIQSLSEQDIAKKKTPQK
ncbi:helix-turn-helix domain-containing protein [Undibacterium sp.]|uniref:helix-turn-helix domain-containing protein n=1 Tax=Undibacterium sp. TaxID=1914977 RepID=UPI00375024C2